MEAIVKGKKKDSEFVSSFIQESVKDGTDTPSAIVARARQMIDCIDEEIRAIEGKKVLRSKLLDVVASFEEATKDKSEEAKLLPLFDMQYPERCKEICGLLRSFARPLPVDSCATYLEQSKGNNITKFCYKQLLERKVLNREGDNLVPGERFDEYMRLVLHESK
jgi:hypothetical protein